MCEAVDFFRQALAEEGLDGEVTHESGELTDTLYLSTDAVGTTETYRHDVRYTTANQDNIEKEMAMAAKRIADDHKQRTTDFYKWGNRCISVQLYDDPTAKCKQCDTMVELSQQSRIFEKIAELSTPHPKPEKRDSLLQSMDDHSKVCLKMYLMGKLREECSPNCSNSCTEFEPKDLYRGST